MNAMPSSEDIVQQQKLLEINRRNLALYLKQQASLGSAYMPPGVANGIHDSRSEIQRIKGILRNWHVPFEDHPDDNESSFILPGHIDRDATKSLPPSRIPYPRNQGFVGRDDELRQLDEWLANPGAAVVVTGLGGVGKTQLAAEYAHRCDADRIGWPGGVHWVSMSEPGHVASSVAALAPLLGIATDLPLSEQVLRVRQVWAAPTQRLLVFDNCEDPALLKAWRPTSGGARVFVTARRTGWHRTVRTFKLGELPRHAVLELLCRPRADELDIPLERLMADPDADAICAHLGDLALAVHLAGAYLEQRPYLPFHAFLAELKTQPLDHAALTALDSDTPTEHLAHVAQTFALSFALLDNGETDALARRILDIAAYCAPAEPIPLELLRRAMMDDGQPTTDVALHRLVMVGLARYANEGRALTIHPLVAAYARRKQVDADSIADALTKVLRDISREVGEAGLPAAMLPVLPHARHAADAAEQRGSEYVATLLNNLGYYFKSIADYNTARTLYERALHIDERTFGPDHYRIAMRLNNLGGVAHAQGDLSAARTLLERALRIDEATLGPTHPYVARDVNNLGLVAQQQGDLQAARTLLERAIQIDEQVFGPDHPTVAIRLNNLGEVARQQGDYARASALHKRALRINETNFGPEHPKVAEVVNNLGLVAAAQDDFPTARALFERALYMCETHLGPAHPQVAIVLNNLGMLAKDEGNLSIAHTLLERALCIWEDKLGHDHPNTQTARNNLAGVLAQTDAHADSETNDA